MDRKEKVLRFLSEKSYMPLNFEELCTVLDVPKEDHKELDRILNELIEEGKVVKSKKGRYASAEKMGYVTGVVVGNKKGFGFVITEDDGDDIYISEGNFYTALHQDRVLVRITNVGKDGRREGEIVKVLSHGITRLVGKYEKMDNYGFVVPDDSRILTDIFIPQNQDLGALNGQKVVAEITKHKSLRHSPEGKIVEILGFPNDFGVDILSIIKGYGFEIEFSQQVLKEAKEVPGSVREEDLLGRRDLRDEIIFTIDGEDTKDIDDAVSITKDEVGNYILGVHIADVSHYVKHGSALDREAFKRGTSVYLVDRVIPMLPVNLSNGICSLNEGVDRLALSVRITITPEGEILDHDIFKSVIRSRKKMTYEKVYKILTQQPEDLMEEYKGLTDSLFMLRELAIILNKRRKARGSIDFYIPEAKIILDDEGVPVKVMKREQNIAHNIIEECMLIANETVAEHMFYMDAPFVYRIHEDPSPEKIANLSEFLYNLGYKLKVGKKIRPRAISDMLDEIKGLPEERVISTLALRSMMKAKYSDKNLGHFGLAAKHYCHFTSPIRRYPDLVCHRIIKDMLEGRLDISQEKYQTFVKDAAIHSSDREQAATDAERDTNDLKKAEYMENHIGEEFEGVISSVTPFGFFVELDNTIEGLVRIENIEDDYYYYDEKNLALVGEHKHREFRIGDIVKVTVAAASKETRQIDFILSEDFTEYTIGDFARQKEKQEAKKAAAKKAIKEAVKKKEKKKEKKKQKAGAKGGRKK